MFRIRSKKKKSNSFASAKVGNVVNVDMLLRKLEGNSAQLSSSVTLMKIPKMFFLKLGNTNKMNCQNCSILHFFKTIICFKVVQCASSIFDIMNAADLENLLLNY